jgi:hypothetical protein
MERDRADNVNMLTSFVIKEDPQQLGGRAANKKKDRN